MNDSMNDLLKQLSLPFHPSRVSWKPGAVKAGAQGARALAMPYADLRAYMERLDEVCGSDWSVAYEPWGEDRIICKLTILGVTRSSTGETTNESEKSEIGGTVAEAQAFKRACAMFALGRYLYTFPTSWADYDPKSRQFTAQAKSKLTNMLVQHYRRATEGQESHREIDPATGEIIEAEAITPTIHGDGDPSGYDDDLWQSNDDAPAPPDKKPKLLSQAQLTRLNVLGVDFYGSKAEWDKKRPELVKAATTGAKTSSKELLPAEADLLIKGLEKRLREKREKEAQAAAAMPHANGMAA